MLIDGDNQDRSPSSKKARGLLAMLSLAPGLSRSRGWLQERLWSDRSTAQADPSFRQALSDIRRGFGRYRDVLRYEKGIVWLDESTIKVELAPLGLGDDASLELFEDLDIRDTAFEAWLRSQRLNYANNKMLLATSKTAARKLPVIVFDRIDAHGPLDEWFLHDLEGHVARCILEYSDVEILGSRIQTPSASIGSGRAGLYLTIGTVSRHGQRLIVSQLETLSDRRILWSNRTSLQDEADVLSSREALQFLNEIVVNALRLATVQINEAPEINLALGLAQEARRRIFLLDRTSLVNADTLLKAAYEREPRGQYLAWRAFLRNTAGFEQLSVAFLDDKVSSQTLAQEALGAIPDNSFVLAIAAQNQLVHHGDSAACLRLLEMCLEQNNANPLAWAFRSNAELALGRLEDCALSASNASAFSSQMQGKHFFKIFDCMVAAGAGDLDRAIEHAKQAILFAPNFRAPLRYLVALYLGGNNHDEADIWTRRLKEVEPDFRPEKLLSADYPVGTLRRLPVIDRVSAALDHRNM